MDEHDVDGFERALRNLQSARVDRRTVLAAALAAGMGGVLSACGFGNGSSGTSQVPGGTLIYRHATFSDDRFQHYLDIFDTQYARKNKTLLSSVYTNYHTVTETEMLGGATYDVMIGDPGYLGKWYHAGLIQSIEGLPGLDKLKQDMDASAIPDLTTPDGKMAGLPYFTAVEGFFHNTELFARANLNPPQTWEEVIDHARTLKGKGIAPVPFAPKWSSAFGACAIAFINIAFSEGMTQVFDKNLKATYDSDPAALKALQTMKTLFSEKLVPADVLTYATSDAVNNFTSQKAAMFMYETYYGPIFNAKDSPIAGKAKMIQMPGATHNVWAQQDAHMLGARSRDRDGAWELCKFMSGTDKNGAYTVPLELYLLEFGLVVPYKSARSDPRVQKVIATYTDPQVFATHMASTKSVGSAVNAPWFSQWQDNLVTEIQQGINGSKDPAAALKASADFARSAQK